VCLMKLNDIDLNKLVVFSTVAKHGGYRGASEELNLTRSAISQAITSLEETLGRKLFNRVGGKLQLTEAAKQVHQDLSQQQQSILSTLSHFTKDSGKIEGQLRIGAYLEFTKSKLMPVVEDFMSSNPQVQMKFIFDAPSRINAMLENDRIDLSISILPHKESKFIESKKLYQEELVLIGRTDLVSHQASKEALSKLPIIDYYPTHLLFKRWWLHQYSRHLKTTNIVSYAATAEMVYEMVKRRLGIGVVPRYVLDNSLRDERVHIIQPTEKRLFDYVWLSQFKKKDRSPAHTEFLGVLYRRFKG
jgi:DNA-binding transcriptional LysR family regulator